jgi:hypothetical protein
MIKAFIDARFLESLGLNDQCRRVVETIDEIKWRSRRRSRLEFFE